MPRSVARANPHQQRAHHPFAPRAIPGRCPRVHPPHHSARPGRPPPARPATTSPPRTARPRSVRPATASLPAILAAAVLAARPPVAPARSPRPRPARHSPNSDDAPQFSPIERSPRAPRSVRPADLQPERKGRGCFRRKWAEIDARPRPARGHSRERSDDELSDTGQIIVFFPIPQRSPQRLTEVRGARMQE